jgi:hypothetical protein
MPSKAIDDTSHTRPVPANQSVDSLDQSSLSADQIIRRGQDTWARVRSDHTWTDWLEVGAALCVGRTQAMYDAAANKPVGRNYNTAFGAWLKKNGFDTIDDGDRSRLFEVMNHRDQIENWRKGLSLNEQLALNHPSTVWRKWKATTVVPDPNAAPKKASPGVKLQESIARLEEENHRMRQEIERGGDDRWSKSGDEKRGDGQVADKLTELLRTIRQSGRRDAWAKLEEFQEVMSAAGLGSFDIAVVVTRSPPAKSAAINAPQDLSIPKFLLRSEEGAHE